MPSKEEIRKIVAERKQAIADTHEMSQAVINRFMLLPELETCNITMTYVDFGKEVRTVPLISELLNQGKKIVVPYCEDGEIQLFLLKNLSQLAPGYFGILEPRIELRRLSEFKVFAEELQLVIVPGLGFDPYGGRVGRGKGYYDRFLAKIPENVRKAGFAFDCQLFDKVPMSETDQYLDIIVSENNIYRRNDVIGI
jgi:5,10-methenyltetrahydrofolate synthetase